MIKMVATYVKLLNSAPNAWGQHVIAEFGPSHVMLRTMHIKFGKDAVDAEITRQFAEIREQGNG